MINAIQNSIGALAKRLGIVNKNLQMWLGFYKSDVIGKELNDQTWSANGGWSVLNGVASNDGSGSTLTNDILTIGEVYKVTVKLATYTSGTFSVLLGSGTESETFNGLDEFTFIGVCSGDAYARISSTNGIGSVAISNISIKEVTQFVKDKSTNSNDAKLFTGKALEFNGNDNIQITSSGANQMGISDFTIAFWINKLGSGGGNQRIIDKRNIKGYTLYLDSTNVLLLELSDGTGNQAFVLGTLTDDIWQRVVVVADRSGNVTCYIDGELKATVDISSKQLSLDDSTDLFIGADAPNGTAYYFSGNLSDIQFYNEVWDSEIDIPFDYNNPNHLVTDNPNTTLTLSNLSAYYALSEGSGSKIYDSTGLGAELVVNGDFATSDDWTANALQWVVSGGKANALGVSGLLSNTGTVVIGSTYVVSFDIVNYTSGSVKVYSGAGADTSPYYSSDGTHTFTFEPNSVNILAYSNSFIGSIDNVSVKLVKADDGTSYDGTSIGATWVDQQPTIPQLGLMDWSKGSNLVEYSEDLTATGWSSQRTGVGVAPIVTNNFALSPIGEMNASRIVFDIGSGTLSTDISQLQNRSTIVNGDTYVTSMYIKSANATDYDISVSDVSSFVQQFTVNQVWQRISLSGSYAGTNGDIRIRLRGHEATSKYADILIYAPQLEPDTLGSYIATSGSIASNATLVQNPNDKGKDVLGNSLRLRERGFNLDGTGYAEVADDDSLDFGTGDFSIEMWAKFAFLHKGSSWNSAVSLGGSVVSTTSSALATKSGKFYFNIGGTTTVSSTPTLVEGQWYHVVGTRTGTTMRLYIDSAVETSTSTSSQTVTNANVKKIGDDTDHSYDRHYEDLIDEVRLYNRALTQKEITNNRKVGLSSHKVGSAFSTEFSSEFGF